MSICLVRDLVLSEAILSLKIYTDYLGKALRRCRLSIPKCWRLKHGRSKGQSVLLFYSAVSPYPAFCNAPGAVMSAIRPTLRHINIPRAVTTQSDQLFYYRLSCIPYYPEL